MRIGMLAPMPSAASSGSIGVGVPAASSTSSRWTAVSWAMRRYQNPTVWSSGHHV